MLARRVNDTAAEKGVKLDLIGTLLSALGLGLIVFGILKSGSWGVVQAKAEAPQWIGLSPVIWLILGGLAVLALFLRWEGLRIGRGEGALIDPKLLRNVQMRSGVISFLFMFLVQAGTSSSYRCSFGGAGTVGDGDRRAATADVPGPASRSPSGSETRAITTRGGWSTQGSC